MLGENEMLRAKRTSSEDFLRAFDAIYKEGPKVKFQNPDAWTKF